MNHNTFTNEYYLMPREAAFLGLPVGNAHSGAPFKQKEMPFFIAPAIGAAAAAIGTAAAVGTAAAIGTAALATVSAIGTVAMVAGTAMSVVGMVTGNKSLKKIGMIVGLAGGIGSLAAGAGASMLAGGEFAMGTAGVESANAALSSSSTAVDGIVAGGGNLAGQISGNTATNVVANASTNVANNAATSMTGGAGLSGVPGGTSLVAQAPGGAAAGLINPNYSLVGSTTGNSLNALANGYQIAPATTFATQTGGATIGGAGSGSGGGFFANLFSGMSASDKWTTATMAASVVKGMGSTNADDLARDQFNQEKANYDRKVANANGVPNMTPWQFSKNAPTTQTSPLAATTAPKAGMLA